MSNSTARHVFEKLCKEMAELDHQIVYNELDGIKIDGKRIKIKPKEEDIAYRFRLFMEMYQGYSEKALRNEIKKQTLRLKRSEKYKKTKLQKIFCPDNLDISPPFIIFEEEK